MPKIEKEKRKEKKRKKGKGGALPNHGTNESDPSADALTTLIQNATAESPKKLIKASPQILQALDRLECSKTKWNHAFCLFTALHSKWTDPKTKPNARTVLHNLMIQINHQYKLGHRYEESNDTWLTVLSPQESAAMEKRRLNTED